jgi:hypothetical protein
MLRFAVAGLGLAALAACTSLGGMPGAQALRSLDYANDDVASLLIAFDLPETIEPMAEGPVVVFDARMAGGEVRSLRAELVRSDAGELAGTLPPPGEGRTYYLFGFSEADKAKLRETQAWAKAQPQGQGGTIAVGMEPRFCATGPVDPATVRYSVQIALPGSTGLAPLVKDQPLSRALAATGAVLPVCDGHSG